MLPLAPAAGWPQVPEAMFASISMAVSVQVFSAQGLRS